MTELQPQANCLKKTEQNNRQTKKQQLAKPVQEIVPLENMRTKTACTLHFLGGFDTDNGAYWVPAAIR